MSSRGHAWLLVGLLWPVALLNYIDRQAIFSVFPLLSQDLSLSALQLGTLSTAFLWVYGLASPWSGFLADRLARRLLIVLSLVAWSLVTWWTGHVGGYAEMASARALMGITEACYMPAALALIAESHGESSRSLATGLHQSGIYAGIVLGGALGGWLGERYGWRACFDVLGLAGLGYAVVLGLALARVKPAATPGLAPARKPVCLPAMRELLGRPNVRIMLAVCAIASTATWTVFTGFPCTFMSAFT